MGNPTTPCVNWHLTSYLKLQKNLLFLLFTRMSRPSAMFIVLGVLVTQRNPFSSGFRKRKPESENATVFLAKRGVMVPGFMRRLRKLGWEYATLCYHALAICNSPEIMLCFVKNMLQRFMSHTNAHAVHGRSTLNDVEHFRNGSLIHEFYTCKPSQNMCKVHTSYHEVTNVPYMRANTKILAQLCSILCRPILWQDMRSCVIIIRKAHGVVMKACVKSMLLHLHPK